MSEKYDLLQYLEEVFVTCLLRGVWGARRSGPGVDCGAEPGLGPGQVPAGGGQHLAGGGVPGAARGQPGRVGVGVTEAGAMQAVGQEDGCGGVQFGAECCRVQGGRQDDGQACPQVAGAQVGGIRGARGCDGGEDAQECQAGQPIWCRCVRAIIAWAIIPWAPNCRAMSVVGGDKPL